ATVVNGSWLVAFSSSRAEVREIPSRILIERFLLPADTDFLCFSRGGRARVALTQKRSESGALVGPPLVLFGARGGGWVSAPVPERAVPWSESSHVLEDGRVVFRGAGRFLVVQSPADGSARRVPMTPVDDGGTANVGADGAYYLSFPVRSATD